MKSSVKLIVLLLLSLTTLFSCQNPSGSTDDLSTVKSLSASLPDEISFNPSQPVPDTSRSAISGLSTDEPLDISELQLDFFNYLLLPSAAIYWCKTDILSWATMDVDRIINVGEVLPMPAGALPPGASVTLDSARYSFNNGTLSIWTTTTFSGDWTLSMKMKLTLDRYGYRAVVSLVQSDSFDPAEDFGVDDYWYWVFDYNFMSRELILYETADTPVTQNHLYSKLSPNTHNRYDLAIDKDYPFDETQNSSIYILNRNDGVYISEYTNDVIADIALYNSDYTYVGKTNFTVGLEPYNTTTYGSLWPADYPAFKTNIRSELNDYINDEGLKGASGNLLSMSEFDGM